MNAPVRIYSDLDRRNARRDHDQALADLVDTRAGIAWWRGQLRSRHSSQTYKDRAALEIHQAYREAFALIRFAKERQAIMLGMRSF